MSAFGVALSRKNQAIRFVQLLADWLALRLLLTGLLILSSLLQVLRSVSKVLRLTSKRIGAGFLLLTLAQLMVSTRQARYISRPLISTFSPRILSRFLYSYDRSSRLRCPIWISTMWEATRPRSPLQPVNSASSNRTAIHLSSPVCPNSEYSAGYST